LIKTKTARRTGRKGDAHFISEDQRGKLNVTVEKLRRISQTHIRTPDPYGVTKHDAKPAD